MNPVKNTMDVSLLNPIPQKRCCGLSRILELIGQLAIKCLCEKSPQLNLSHKLPACVQEYICEFLTMKERSQLYCVNKQFRTIIEKRFYGTFDMENKRLCQNYLEEARKLGQPIKEIDTEDLQLRRNYSDLQKILETKDDGINRKVRSGSFRYHHGVVYDTMLSISKRIKSLDEQRFKLASTSIPFWKAMNINYCEHQIMDLFAGRKKFEAIPIFSQKGEQLTADQMTHPIMRGTLTEGATCFAIKAEIHLNQKRVGIKVAIFANTMGEQWDNIRPNFGIGMFLRLIDKNGNLCTDKKPYYLLKKLIKGDQIEFEYPKPHVWSLRISFSHAK